MSSARPDFQIARFDFGALRDFARPFEPAEEEPVVIEITTEPEAPPPPPTYSQEQLDRAMADAREQGRQHGMEEGRQQMQQEDVQRQQAIQQALASLNAQLQQAHGQYQRCLDEGRRETSQLALAIARQVCHLTLRSYPAAFFESLVARCLPILLRQPKLVAVVHTDLVDAVEESLRQLRMETNYEGILEVRANPSLAAYDARLQWEDGAAEIRAEDIWHSVETILQETQARPAPPEATTPDHSA
jgi:flagellar assembly protein FliH